MWHKSETRPASFSPYRTGHSRATTHTWTRYGKQPAACRHVPEIQNLLDGLVQACPEISVSVRKTSKTRPPSSYQSMTSQWTCFWHFPILTSEIWRQLSQRWPHFKCTLLAIMQPLYAWETSMLTWRSRHVFSYGMLIRSKTLKTVEISRYQDDLAIDLLKMFANYEKFGW